MNPLEKAGRLFQAMLLLLVTGLPGTGKTTLARRLARRYRMPLLYKDLIKESLLDAEGEVDRDRSRALSDASFAILFAGLHEFAMADVDVILEGNFRPGGHEAALLAALSLDDSTTPDIQIVQILCGVSDTERRARLIARHSDPGRHKGHYDMDDAVMKDRTSDAFLDLPGERLLCSGSEDEIEILKRVELVRPKHA